MFFNKKNTERSVRQDRDEANQHQKSADTSTSGMADAKYRKWQQDIGKMLNSIMQKMISCESDFLTIGAQLYEYQSRAGSIAGSAKQIAALVADKEGKTTLLEVKSLLATLHRYLDHWNSQWHNSERQLRTAENLLHDVQIPLDEFRKIQKKLRMFGISTKIESARMGTTAAGFETLANDIEVLSVQVIDKSAQITCQIGKLSRILRETLLHFGAIEQNHRTRAHQVIQALNASLEEISGINQRCTDAITVISEVSSLISGKLAQVVMSLQFHDIVRQQIEHVVKAFSSIIEQTSSSGESKFIEEFGAVTELQAAQLQHSAHELSSALERIVTSLEGIVKDVVSLAQDVRNIAGIAGKADSSRFAQMASDMVVVTDSLRECSAGTRQLLAAVDEVGDTVQTVSTHVDAIEQIGTEIELIALNSQIKAARTGREGAALAVLAEAIQHLSLETLAQTMAVTSTLKGITSEVEGLNQQVDSGATALDSEVTSIMLELGRLLQMLQELNSDTHSTVLTMEQGIEGLADEISVATNCVASQQSMVSVLNEGVDALTMIVAEVRSELPEMAAKQIAVRLRELSKNYTMRSERKVHEQMFGHSPEHGTPGKTPEAFIAPTVASHEDDYGDNVELF